jgi:hypothetical protein
MRNQHGQRTGHNGKTLWSSSQLKQRLALGGCDVRWGHNRLLKLEEPQGKNAGRGTEAHSECENWYLFGKLPSTPHACAALLTVKASPRYKSTKKGWIEAPHFVELEVPVRFDHGGQSFIGYVDMAYDWSFEQVEGRNPWDRQCDPDVAPLGSTGVTVIHDFKFSSSTNYAMTPEELEQDVAANIYAWEAFLGGAERVLCRWVYTAFDGQKPKEVWCEMDRQAVQLRMDELAAIAADGSEKRQLFKDGKLNVLDLEKNFGQCHAYRQDCPFMGTCNPHREVQKIRMRRDTDMASFEEQAENVAGTEPVKTLPTIPGAKKAPPPPPVKKAPPPPPVKSSPVDAAVAAAAKGPLTESGTFNAPGNPFPPSATPEQAAAAQGRGKVEDLGGVEDDDLDYEEDRPAPVDNSDLEALDTAQLKLLATSMGLTFLPRAKTASMIKLITEARAKGVPADRTVEDVATEAEELATEAEELATELEATPEVAAEIVQETPKKAEVRKGFDLYSNCLPQGEAYHTLPSILQQLAANFEQATGVKDYRLVDFGKGPGLMAESIADELESGRINGNVVVDIRTHEGAAFVSTFERFARRVIRGF